MEKKHITLSVGLAVKDEERNIDACLSSVSDLADEIVVVDGGSNDRTVTLAKKHHARVIATDNPPIFHINKQKALDACRGDWILQLDADEVVTEDLKKEIVGIIGQKIISRRQKNMTGENEQGIKHGTYDNEHETDIGKNLLSHAFCHMSNTYNGYCIPRKNYFLGHWMQKGGQYPDYVIRLVKKGKARFPCKSVHEQIEVDGTVGYLRNPLIHYSYRTEEEYWKKADVYTSLTAMDMRNQHIPISFASWLNYMIIKPLQTFLSLYIRHKGYMDGWYGYMFAYWSALHFRIAWEKYVHTAGSL